MEQVLLSGTSIRIETGQPTVSFHCKRLPERIKREVEISKLGISALGPDCLRALVREGEISSVAVNVSG